ncbi:G patch domain-containing protein 4-like [Poeciliopsis prolifica]|uniref:G patch domain-containing protein 4-like n=1 Tax=Poeciliopsis prolifica TaxID=188132 RepID=UPI0024143C59|nr:G patch domain-containing protein 4-like [Poeciliopsis prolifica]XP_054878829.1 G patch domain-containing protein 4-like [Poeciliopsis prolifica]
MAKAEQDKSRGLKFAEQLLLSHGWERGKGLGRAENGISEAIKVKVKCDKGGIGHREGEQFSFHWWDHVFNKASSSLQVEAGQDGIKLKKTPEEGEEEEGAISNKKPRKSLQNKSKLYGRFVKSATLLSGQEEPEPKAPSSDSSSSDEEEEQKLDLSSTTRLSDADLMKVCGGRTAHKGARHGLSMSAKLARLEQQEAEFLTKYGKKNQTGSSPVVRDTVTHPEETSHRKKKKKKKKKKKCTESCAELNRDESPEAGFQPEKKKKRRKDKTEGEKETEEEELIVGGNIEDQKEDGGNPSAEETEPLPSNCNRKKKKKSAPHDADPAETGRSPGQSSQSDRRSKQEAEVTMAPEKQKRKKSRKDKLVMEKLADEEELPSKKKKKKSDGGSK